MLCVLKCFLRGDQQIDPCPETRDRASTYISIGAVKNLMAFVRSTVTRSVSVARHVDDWYGKKMV